jgi:HD-GYP domain-containing protein (c-di-GMP phosphodiesterase class II)
MANRGRRVLVVGGDSSIWVGLSSVLEDSSQLFVPTDSGVDDLLAADTFDAVVVVGSDERTWKMAQRLQTLGLAGRTVLVCDREDATAAARAVNFGIGGVVKRGSAPERVAAALDQVARGGIIYDAPASQVLRDSNSPTGSSMDAARALASALELKDTYTGGHAERVTALAMLLAEAAELPDAAADDNMRAAFLLHDVGKIGIPESILLKPAGLTDTERRVLETHPILGERIVSPLQMAECVRQVIRYHHERWDGNGYPDGLSGFAIPAPARVFSIADVLDAMTSARPYRRPLPFDEALAHIMDNAGTQFDPALCALAQRTFSTLAKTAL